MDFLTNIISQKRMALERCKTALPIDDVRARALEVRHGAHAHALRAALNNRERLNVIAEIKRASPSKGNIRAGADVAQVARDYEAGGAVAISVLTEETQFLGSLDDLREVEAAVSVPVLRKDFIFDEYQLYEGAAAGADAILLIVAALDDQTLERLRAIAEEELGLDALVEVHSQDELRRAISCGAKLIGVNNRDLRTFEVTMDTSIQLARDLPDDLIAISESGLRTASDLVHLRSLGYKGFLIGESLMKQSSPGEALRNLLAETRRLKSGATV